MLIFQHDKHSSESTPAIVTQVERWMVLDQVELYINYLL